MESELKRKEQELQKRTGARFRAGLQAGAQDAIKINVSHRGLGAFARTDMIWPPRKVDETPSPANSKCVPSSQPDKQVPVQQVPVQQVPVQEVPIQQDSVAADVSTAPTTVESSCSSSPPSALPAETKENTPDVTQEDRRPVDGQSDDPAPVQQDTVADDVSTAPGTVEAGCSPCPPSAEPADTKENTSTNVTEADRRAVDNGQSDDQPGDESNAARSDSDATQQPQQPASSAAEINENLLAVE